jgi:hypothetical protein
MGEMLPRLAAIAIDRDEGAGLERPSRRRRRAVTGIVRFLGRALRGRSGGTVLYK